MFLTSIYVLVKCSMVHYVKSFRFVYLNYSKMLNRVCPRRDRERECVFEKVSERERERLRKLSSKGVGVQACT